MKAIIIGIAMACVILPLQTTDLNGTRTLVKQEMGGQALPAGQITLTLKDSLYTVVAESVDKGVVRYHGNQLDIYGRDGVNAGKHFTAIYQLENGKLTVCYNLTGNGYP